MIEVTDATLTRVQKNRILELVRQCGPPPDDFQWSEKRREEYFNMAYYPYEVSVLTHRPTEHYCIFGGHCITTSSVRVWSAFENVPSLRYRLRVVQP
jgi:hypothetical protein